jgi:hypothetical protein
MAGASGVGQWYNAGMTEEARKLDVMTQVLSRLAKTNHKAAVSFKFGENEHCGSKRFLECRLVVNGRESNYRIVFWETDSDNHARQIEEALYNLDASLASHGID